MCVVAAVVLGLTLVRLDAALEDDLRFAFDAGPDGAREVLSAVSSSMITFTGLVFSITIVVLQLTSSQFSPRVLRTFLRDRLTQFALGTFVATFVYSVTVLRTVTSGEDAVFVPAISTTVALVLLLLSVGMFVAYIHHIATSIQVSSIMTAIGAETRATLHNRYPTGLDEPGQPTSAPDLPVAAVLPAPRTGVVTHIDIDRLVTMARDAGVVLRTELGPGDFIAEGAPLIEVLGAGAVDAGAVDAGAVVGRPSRCRRTGRCSRTSRSASVSSSTSPRRRCRRGSTTRPRRCRRSTSFMTCSAGSRRDRCVTVSTATTGEPSGL